MTKPSSSFYTAVTIFVFYVLLLGFYGYQVGDEDLCETSAYAMMLNDPAMFSGDFYLNHLSGSRVNERYPFSLLLSCFDPNSEWTYFLLHTLCSCLLIWGLLKLSRLFLQDTFWHLAFVTTTLFFSYGMTLGENELWYNYVMPSLPAKAIGIWTLYFYLSRKRHWAYILLALAAFLQPIVAAQLALIYLCLDLWSWIQEKKIPSLHQIWPPLLFGCTAGVWTIMIYFQQHDQQLLLEPQQFFEILETRLAHHFFPNYFPLKSWLTFGSIFVVGIWVWHNEHKPLFQLCLGTAIGWLIYSIAVLGLDSSFIASLQWFKTTIWIKVLCILGISKWLEDNLKWESKPLRFAILLIALLTFFLLRYQDRIYHFPWSDYSSAEIEIAALAREYSNPESSFIVPPDMTALRFFGHRGVFIDFKSNLHTHEYLAEAEARRLSIYGLDLDLRRSRKNVMHGMKRHYLGLTMEQIMAFKSSGATHLITSPSHKLALTVVVANSEYVVYHL